MCQPALLSRLLLVCCAVTVVAVQQSIAVERVPWTTSQIKGSPEPPRALALTRVFPQLQFEQPVELMRLADTGRYILLEVGGKVFTFEDRDDCAEKDLAFDVSNRIDNFARAYGIAVHPRFQDNREVFICYAGNPVARPDGTRLSRFKMTAENPPRIDPNSEEVLLTWASGGHNGCAIRFDREGLLYFSAGDGARPYPPDEYDVSQDLSDLRATICRIDVDRKSPGKNYAIPKDNPFIGVPNARPEIWSYGFRNPWRFSIDAYNGQIFCGDVGWELWELVHLVERGSNHGWSIFEGPQPIRSDIAVGPTPIRGPIVAYPHTEGLSVTGGFIYHGEQHAELQNTYLYGDYVTGLIWGLRMESDQVVSNEILAETGLPIITFAETSTEEVLVVSYQGGIYALVQNPASRQPSAFPRKLSETGLFASLSDLEPAPGVYPYHITSAAWQDGTSSEFLVAVPDYETIVTGKGKRNWRYPVDTVFARTLFLSDHPDSRRRIETQILHYNGLAWQPYCYVWNEEQSDADLIGAAGAESTFAMPATGEEQPQTDLTWRHHSRSECRACHINQTGGAFGFSYENLADDSLIVRGEDQTDAFVQLGILDKQAPRAWNLPRMVDPEDSTKSLESRARSYLTANCAHCHCRGGGGTVPLDLLFGNKLHEINAVNFLPTQGDFGISNGKIITPGDPYRSILFYRVATCGSGHMPKLWKRDNDKLGLRLVHDWILSLDPSAETNSKAAEGDKPDPGSTPYALREFHKMLMMSEPNASSAAKEALADANAITSGLYERFLPVAQRIQRLGTDIEPKQILALEGDATRGREQFLASQSLQCRNCHRLAGVGQMVGPDLDSIAKDRSPAELLESILDPSKKIDPKFAAHSILTVDGQVLNGLKLEQDEEHVTIRSADGKTHHILIDDIEEMKTQAVSLMPTELAAHMTASELADLLAFLSEQK